MDALVRCPRCWKRDPATARFCRRCGCALTRSAPPPPIPVSGAAFAPARGGRGVRMLLALLVTGAFALLGLLIIGSLVHSSVIAPGSVIVPGDSNSGRTMDAAPPAVTTSPPINNPADPPSANERYGNFPGAPDYRSVQIPPAPPGNTIDRPSYSHDWYWAHRGRQPDERQRR
jgi:hypothetical protein